MALLVALVLTAPLVLTMFGGIWGDRRGTVNFYGAVAQAIPTLVVAFAIELRAFISDLRRIAGVDGFGRIILFVNFWLLLAGEFAALDALSCDGRCATTTTFAYAASGLIAGAALVLATLALALYLTAQEPDPDV